MRFDNVLGYADYTTLGVNAREALNQQLLEIENARFGTQLVMRGGILVVSAPNETVNLAASSESSTNEALCSARIQMAASAEPYAPRTQEL